MKILVVSDTHKDNRNFFRVLEMECPFELLIHCGDTGDEEEMIEAAAQCRVEIVAGNVDYYSELPHEKIVEAGKYRFMITHGNTYYVNAGYEELGEAAKKKRVDFCFYGHTHCPSIESYDGIVMMNPGSLSYPRQEGKRPSYGILEIEDQEEPRYEIKYL